MQRETTRPVNDLLKPNETIESVTPVSPMMRTGLRPADEEREIELFLRERREGEDVPIRSLSRPQARTVENVVKANSDSCRTSGSSVSLYTLYERKERGGRTMMPA